MHAYHLLNSEKLEKHNIKNTNKYMAIFCSIFDERLTNSVEINELYMREYINEKVGFVLANIMSYSQQRY